MTKFLVLTIVIVLFVTVTVSGQRRGRRACRPTEAANPGCTNVDGGKPAPNAPSNRRCVCSGTDYRMLCWPNTDATTTTTGTITTTTTGSTDTTRHIDPILNSTTTTAAP